MSYKKNILLFLTLLINSIFLNSLPNPDYHRYLSPAEFYYYCLNNDDVYNFQRVYPRYIHYPSILREAANAQANKIVDFLINNTLFNIDSDPATLTWFALWRPYHFYDLIKKLNPSVSTIDYALYLLETDYFGDGPKKIEYDQAKQLLLNVGATLLHKYYFETE